MEDCVDLGLVKHIGCSNFNSKQLQRLLDEGRIQPAVNQVMAKLKISLPLLHGIRLLNYFLSVLLLLRVSYYSVSYYVIIFIRQHMHVIH